MSMTIGGEEIKGIGSWKSFNIPDVGKISFAGNFTKDECVLKPGSTVKLYLDEETFIKAEIATVVELKDGSLDFTIKNVEVIE